jgi:hypothetical protein
VRAVCRVLFCELLVLQQRVSRKPAADLPARAPVRLARSEWLRAVAGMAKCAALFCFAHIMRPRFKLGHVRDASGVEHL